MPMKKYYLLNQQGKLLETWVGEFEMTKKNINVGKN